MRLKTLSFSLTILGLALTGTAAAHELAPSVISGAVSAFRMYKDTGVITVKVPTVVEVPFTTEFIERFDFAVFDSTAQTFEPHFFKQETVTNEIPISIFTNPAAGSAASMLDNDVKTFVDFPLPESEQGRVQITLQSGTPITSSALTTLLDNNVALPTALEIRALVGSDLRIVVASRRMDQNTIYFPRTTSNQWVITFTFGQPLRISELRLSQENAVRVSSRTVRFLAQPSHSYRLYFDPDRQPSPIPEEGEAGDLRNARDVIVVAASTPRSKPEYVIADVDTDGVPDVRDNCVAILNVDQKDVNANGRGDACDDFDHDGLINSQDNCPDNPNRDQRDTDSDAIGDVCDSEESRVTERYTWLPWLGIGAAAVVLVVLLILTVRSKGGKEEDATNQ